jgi:uncharacterized protein (TIGR01244 family)
MIKLDDMTYVGPQINVSDIKNLNRLGIRTIIIARPENETADQPEISTICETADVFGIAVYQIPIIPGNITDDQVREFNKITAKLSDPVFAYCRSGLRAISLWALNKAANGFSVDAILHISSNANYDLTALSSRLGQVSTHSTRKTITHA